VWTRSAFEALDTVFGTVETESGAKRGYRLPRVPMTNSDLTRLINSDEIQSIVNAPKVRPVVLLVTVDKSCERGRSSSLMIQTLEKQGRCISTVSIPCAGNFVECCCFQCQAIEVAGLDNGRRTHFAALSPRRRVRSARR